MLHTAFQVPEILGEVSWLVCSYLSLIETDRQTHRHAHTHTHTHSLTPAVSIGLGVIFYTYSKPAEKQIFPGPEWLGCIYHHMGVGQRPICRQKALSIGGMPRGLD